MSNAKTAGPSCAMPQVGERYRLEGQGTLTVSYPEWTAVLTRGLVYKVSATLPGHEPDLEASPPLVPVRIVAAHSGDFRLIPDKPKAAPKAKAAKPKAKAAK